MNTHIHIHLRDHIYLAQFRDEFILLDTKRDKYTICFQQFSELLMSHLEGTKTNSDGTTLNISGEQSPQDLENIQKLITDNIIEKKDTLYPFYIDRKLHSHGVSNVDWKLSIENKGMRLNFSVFKAFMTLLKVNYFLKKRGLYSAIQLIKNNRKNQTNYFIPKEEELRGLSNIVNKACLIYPIKTKCLEWSITFVLLALKRRWKCNLEIGVQNYPFLSHAWVECDGKVVMNSQDLRKALAIILNEPFRKLKI